MDGEIIHQVGYALNSALTAHINKVDNPHAVTKAQVGLGNADNTSDANKPISNAVQTALSNYYDITRATEYLSSIYTDANDIPSGVRGLAVGSLLNLPASEYNDITTISQFGASDLLQIVYPFRGDGKFYMRNKGSGAEQWSNWLKIWHSGDFTATEVTNWREVRTWWQNVGQYLKRDAPNQALYTDENFYSTKGVSALGLGSGGGSGGGGVDMLDAWANYTEAKANYYVPASLLVSFRNDTLNR